MVPFHIKIYKHNEKVVHSWDMNPEKLLKQINGHKFGNSDFILLRILGYKEIENTMLNFSN